MTRFCVFAEPRSGTTFFNRSISMHPDVHAFGEVMPGHTNVFGFHHYWLQEIEKDPAKISIEHLHNIFQAYIRSLFAQRAEKAVGFDIKYYQLEWKSDFLNVLGVERFKIFHIIRTNLARRYVSWLLHQPANRNLLQRPMHTTSHTEPVLIRVPRPGQLVELFGTFERKINSYSRLLGDNFPCLTIHYEDMIDSQANFLQKDVADSVYSFLGVAPLQESPATPLKKMNPSKLRYSVLNYHQVVEALLQTRYEWFLDDAPWDAENIDLHRELYLGHQETGRDLGKALAHYLNASAANPKDAEPYYHMALVYASTKRLKKMEEMLNKAMELCDDEAMLTHYRHARERLLQAQAGSGAGRQS